MHLKQFTTIHPWPCTNNWKFTEKELSYNALMDDFEDPPHTPFHCYPSLTRKKKTLINEESLKPQMVFMKIHSSYFNYQPSTTCNSKYKAWKTLLVKADESQDPKDAITCGFQQKKMFFIDKKTVLRGSIYVKRTKYRPLVVYWRHREI